MCEMGFGMHDKEMVNDQEQGDGTCDKGAEGNRGRLGAGMVKKRGLFGRTWDKLSNQQKLGVILFCAANALLALFLFVPQVGPVLIGVLYSIELVILLGIGIVLMLPEEGI